jgi:alkylation response protein AidB-like acyl-CoA dehydrogenase
MSAIFTGVARAAFEEALTYCRERVQGGRPICEHQLVQKQLFDMFIKVESARALSRGAMTYNATTIPPATQYSIAAKVYCTQAAFEVSSDAIQLHGGYGRGWHQRRADAGRRSQDYRSVPPVIPASRVASCGGL